MGPEVKSMPQQLEPFLRVLQARANHVRTMVVWVGLKRPKWWFTGIFIEIYICICTYIYYIYILCTVYIYIYVCIYIYTYIQPTIVKRWIGSHQFSVMVINLLKGICIAVIFGFPLCDGWPWPTNHVLTVAPLGMMKCGHVVKLPETNTSKTQRQFQQMIQMHRA